MKATTARSAEPHLQHQRMIVLKRWSRMEIRWQTTESYRKLKQNGSKGDFVHTHTHVCDYLIGCSEKET